VELKEQPIYGGLDLIGGTGAAADEDEIRRLNNLVADLTLDNQALKGSLNRK
jgi:hypothetical protein